MADKSDNIHLRLSPDVGDTLRSRAKQFAPGTIEAYVTALVKNRPLAPMPPAFSRLGVAVTRAIAKLNELKVAEIETPALLQIDEAIDLLQRAQAYGVEVARVWNREKRDAFNVDEEPWRSTG